MGNNRKIPVHRQKSTGELDQMKKSWKTIFEETKLVHIQSKYAYFKKCS